MNPLIEQTAGALATTMVPTVLVRQTVGEVFSFLETTASEFETVDYIYVIDNAKLVGVLSLHELLTADKTATVGAYMTAEVAYVHRSTDQEHVAHLALAQNIKAVPVLTDEGEFFGVVTADTILRILRDEQTEDVMRYAGINIDADRRLANFTVRQHVMSRLPWLVVGLLGGVVAAYIIEHFTGILKEVLLLAAFIPAIIYIADAVGSQTQMVYVRSLVHKQQRVLFATIGREVAIATMIGAVLAIIIGSVTNLWIGDGALAATLSVSVFLAALANVIIAVILPWSFHRLGHDPALATGPLTTVIGDVVSLVIYFVVATVIIL